MGPAIALRLRQHLTLTPQVQQALRLLQMSALEFAQEMEQALAANPFLEENPDAAPAAEAPTATKPPARRGRSCLPQESSAAPAAREREQDDWGGVADAAAHACSEHLREQLMISQMGERDRALAHMIDRQPRRRRLLQGELRGARRAACRRSTTCAPRSSPPR